MTESFGDIAGEPDLASKIAAAIMGLRWTRISDADECDKRHGQLQEIVAKYLAASPPPPAGAAGGGSGDPGALSAAAEEVAQIIAHNLCGYVDEVDAENFLNVALTTAQKILALVSSTSQAPRPGWVKAYEAECQRTRADFNAQSCITENFPQITAPQQPAAQGDPKAREATPALSTPTPDLGAQGEPADRIEIQAAHALKIEQLIAQSLASIHRYIAVSKERSLQDDVDRLDEALLTTLFLQGRYQHGALENDVLHRPAGSRRERYMVLRERPMPSADDMAGQGEPLAREAVAGKIQAIAEHWRGVNGGIYTIRAMSLEMADLFLALIAHADGGGSDA